MAEHQPAHNTDFESFTNITIRFPRYSETKHIHCPCSLTLCEAFAQVDCPREVLEASRILDSTLSAKRDLGPLDKCLAQTLAGLELWPSATIEVQYPGDDEEEWTVIVKSVKNLKDQIKVRFLRAMDKVSLLKKRVASRSVTMTPATALKFIYGGKVLQDDDCLIQCGVSSGDVVLCLAVESQPVSVNISSSNQPVATSNLNDSGAGVRGTYGDESVPLCRICYGPADVDHPLITPCRCNGSIRCVHLECLNSWRSLAPTEASYRRCDQCGYEYRFQRTRLAEFLLSKTGVWTIAISFCIMLLYLGAYLVHYSPEFIHTFIDKYSWIPHVPRVMMVGNRRLMLFLWFPQTLTSLNHHLDFLKGGTFFFGAIGFGQYIFDEILHWYFHRELFGGYINMHTSMMLLWFCSLHSGEMPRIVVIVGFAGCAHVVAMRTHTRSRAIAQWLGERILAVE